MSAGNPTEKDTKQTVQGNDPRGRRQGHDAEHAHAVNRTGKSARQQAAAKDIISNAAGTDANIDGGAPQGLSSSIWTWSVLLTVLLLFGVGGAWAMLATISGAVIASGSISPQSGIQTVQHPEGGVIKEIRVRAGDMVRQGDVLVVLEDAEIRTLLDMVETEILAMEAEIARLEAERDRREQIHFPEHLIRLGLQTKSVRRLLDNQQNLFRERQDLQKSQKAGLRQQMAALERQLAGLAAQLKALHERLRLIDDEIAAVAPLLEKGLANKARLLALQRQQASLQGELGRIISEQARTREIMGQISLRIASLEQDFLSKVLEQLAALRRELSLKRRKRLELQRKLDNVLLRAPVTGRILEISNRTVGGVIGPREPIMQIVPANDPLIVNARIRPTDIDQVFVGQQARVLFTAFNSSTTPQLVGQVRTILPAPLMDKTTQEPYYQVEIIVPLEELKSLPANMRLIPGMPGEIFLTTRERTPMDILLSPLKDSIRRAMRSS